MSSVRTGFLGPLGTWADEALSKHYSPSEIEAVPLPSVPDVIMAVSEGDVEQGIVPIENALEGSVSATLDYLAFEVDNVLITREIDHPIHHKLLARTALPFGEIVRLVSIPIAQAQCRNFIREHLPEAETVAAKSTADAVKLVSESPEKWAAIGSQRAADIYGCKVLADDIADRPDNMTRFVMISSRPALQDLDRPYKTSIVCTIAHDQPGSLLQILQEFAHRYVNLTKIESRPSKKGLGDYVFFIDVEGKREDPAVAAALDRLEGKLARVKMLGSYPVG